MNYLNIIKIDISRIFLNIKITIEDNFENEKSEANKKM